jgi:site-specific DNA-cytosine methylase
MKTVSLFSGIGGLDLGLEDAGHEIIMQVESDPHCVQASAPPLPAPLSVFPLLPRPSDTATQLPRPRSHPPPPPSQVLQHHFPGRELHRDVADVSDLPPETELLAAGFPCPVRAASSPEPRRPVRRPRRWRAVPDARRPR